MTGAEVTAPAPVKPVMVVGPVAVRLTVLAAMVPPLSLVMVFTSVSTGAISELVMEHVEVWPGVKTKLEPVSVPAVQLQAPCA